MGDVLLQRCGRCKVEKPQADFSPSYRGKVGTWCRVCFAAHKRGVRTAVSHEQMPCANCSVPFTPKQRKAASAYCSRKCIDAARRKRLRQHGPGALRDYDRRRNIHRLYGISLELYDQILAEQDGRCAICGDACKTYGNLSVDHNHETGEIRGLLCNRCNRANGMYEDSPDLLIAAAKYLKRKKPTRHVISQMERPNL